VIHIRGGRDRERRRTVTEVLDQVWSVHAGRVPAHPAQQRRGIAESQKVPPFEEEAPVFVDQNLW
jgi:hypothetical protein